jgi:pilus assembly protein Flp/PilA
MLNRIEDIAGRLWNDESGASLLEYSVLVGLITAAVVGTIFGVSGWMGNKWNHLQTTLNNSPG